MFQHRMPPAASGIPMHAAPNPSPIPISPERSTHDDELQRPHPSIAVQLPLGVHFPPELHHSRQQTCGGAGRGERVVQGVAGSRMAPANSQARGRALGSHGSHSKLTKQDVGVEGAFVRFVHEDAAVLREQEVVLQLPAGGVEFFGEWPGCATPKGTTTACAGRLPCGSAMPGAAARLWRLPAPAARAPAPTPQPDLHRACTLAHLRRMPSVMNLRAALGPSALSYRTCQGHGREAIQCRSGLAPRGPAAGPTESPAPEHWRWTRCTRA